jgi:hypothetical protein
MGAEELRGALRSTDEIELIVTGRISGRESSRPVWFVEEGETLYLLPVTGSDSNWYKNLQKSPAIRLTADGTELSADARPIDDSAKVDDVVEKFRGKYGAERVTAYYSKLDVAVEVPL